VLGLFSIYRGIEILRLDMCAKMPRSLFSFPETVGKIKSLRAQNCHYEARTEVLGTPEGNLKVPTRGFTGQGSEFRRHPAECKLANVAD